MGGSHARCSLGNCNRASTIYDGLSNCMWNTPFYRHILRCRGWYDLLEPCLEAFSEAGTSASQARFVLGGRFAILFVLSSSNLSNSSASYPDRSIFLSFFIVIPVEKESVKHTRWLSKGNASGASARVNTRRYEAPARSTTRNIYFRHVRDMCGNRLLALFFIN